jgi:hypothetical protein
MDPFLPYFAGFFDGEGSIGIYPNGSGQGRTLRVQLTQNATPLSTALLHECRTRWGGAISRLNRNGKRAAWIWQASAESGAGVLEELHPWLRLKQPEAEIALAYWSERARVKRDPGGRWIGFTTEEFDLGLRAEAALKAAKRRIEMDPDQLMADVAKRVDVRNTYRQMVNL